MSGDDECAKQTPKNDTRTGRRRRRGGGGEQGGGAGAKKERKVVGGTPKYVPFYSNICMCRYPNAHKDNLRIRAWGSC